MKTKINIFYLFIAFSIIGMAGCMKDERPGPAGRDATVYYSEWFSPSTWSGSTGDWYFDASAPDLTKDIVEGGVVLAYCWLAGDLYSGSTVRPLPAYAVGANWDFLIHSYGTIQFTSDMTAQPSIANKFRFIAIPGTITALKAKSPDGKKLNDLRNMSYTDVCKLYNIPE